MLSKVVEMKKQLCVNQDYQLVNAKYKLNTSEIKFILCAISQIDSIRDEVLKDYEIKISELEQTLQAEQHETRLKQFAKKIMSKPLEVPTADGWLIANWFSDVEYIRGQAKFIVRFSEKLKPYLLDLKERFVSYNLKYILPLTSTYSVRIYQLLKEYEKLQVRYFDVDELQELLQVPKSYKRYDNFKRKILQVAEKELKEHTDIHFTLEEEKTGRKVTRLLFKIHPNINNKSTNAPVLFNAEESPLNQYVGKNVMYKKCFYDKIIEIIPFTDGSIKVTFENGLRPTGSVEKPIIRFQSEKELINAIN